MKFVKKIPPTDHELSKDLVEAGWSKIKEPKNLGMTILISIPIMFLNGLISILVMLPFYNPFARILADQSLSFTLQTLEVLFAIPAIFLFLILHELLHAIFIPNFIKSDKTFWGITINGGFVSTTEKIQKGRFVLISIAPFFLLSIILPLVLGLCNRITGFMMFLIIMNAMGSCVDLFNIILIMFQSGKKDYIISNGFETYVK